MRPPVTARRAISYRHIQERHPPSGGSRHRQEHLPVKIAVCGSVIGCTHHQRREETTQSASSSNQAENNYFIGLMLLAVTAFLAFLSAFLVPHGGKPDHAKHAK